MEIVSKKLQFNKANLKRTAKVLAWSIASVAVLQLIDLVGQFDIPVQYTLLVPVVNSALYALKDFFSEQAEESK